MDTNVMMYYEFAAGISVEKDGYECHDGLWIWYRLIAWSVFIRKYECWWKKLLKMFLKSWNDTRIKADTRIKPTLVSRLTLVSSLTLIPIVKKFCEKW